MTTQQYTNLGYQTAITSFLLGTLIFGLYFLSSSIGLLFVGYAFIAITGLINLGILIAILLKANKDKNNRTKLLTTCGLMLLNIPVMLFYCWVTIILLNTLRITFTNATQATMTDINIVGCGGGHIDQLEAGQSKTIWVDITGDCALNLDYLSDGVRQEEGVAGYITNSMGQKMKHNIGGTNDEQF